MRYKTKLGIIRSENAAKSDVYQARAVVEYLRSYNGVGRTLDFGCGKLRYAKHLVEISGSVTFVDSKLQLTRKQTILGTHTTIYDYVPAHFPHCQVIAFEDISSHTKKYDLILCSNVLSAIPCAKTIKTVLFSIHRLLKSKGSAVFVHQHKNARFNKFQSGKKQLHGFLYRNVNSVSYYGILDKQKTESILRRHGFQIIKGWVDGQRNIVEAKKCNT